MSTSSEAARKLQESLQRMSPMKAFEEYLTLIPPLNFYQKWLAEYDAIMQFSHGTGSLIPGAAATAAMASASYSLSQNFIEDECKSLEPVSRELVSSSSTAEITCLPNITDTDLTNKREKITRKYLDLLDTLSHFLQNNKFPHWESFVQNLKKRVIQTHWPRSTFIARDSFLENLDILLTTYRADAGKKKEEEERISPSQGLSTFWYEGAREKSKHEAEHAGVGIIFLSQRYGLNTKQEIEPLLRALQSTILETGKSFIGNNTQVVMKSLELECPYSSSLKNLNDKGAFETVIISEDSIVNRAVIYFVTREPQNPTIYPALKKVLNSLHIEEDNSVDGIQCSGMGILNQTFLHKQTKTLKLLLKNNYYKELLDIFGDNDGNSLLLKHLSSQELDGNLISDFIQAGCDLTATNRNNENALSWAVKHHHHRLIPSLLEQFRKKLSEEAFKQQLSALLDIAIFSGDLGMIALLLDEGADPVTENWNHALEANDLIPSVADFAALRLKVMSSSLDIEELPRSSSGNSSSTNSNSSSSSDPAPSQAPMELGTPGVHGGVSVQMPMPIQPMPARRATQPTHVRIHARCAALWMGLYFMSPTQPVPEELWPQLRDFLKSYETNLTTNQLEFLQAHACPDITLRRKRPWLDPFVSYLTGENPGTQKHAEESKRLQENTPLQWLDRIMWHLTASSPTLSVPAIDLLRASGLVLACARSLSAERLAQWAAYRGYMDVITALCVETDLAVRYADLKLRTLMHFACAAQVKNKVESDRQCDAANRLMLTAPLANEVTKQLIESLHKSNPTPSLYVQTLASFLQNKLNWKVTGCDERAILLPPDLTETLNLARTFTGTPPVQLLHVPEQLAFNLVHLYIDEAHAGNASAINNLGWCYHFGVGVQRDGKQALALYKEAAEKGCVTARNNLAVSRIMYDTTNQKRQREAFKVFEEITNQYPPGHHRHTAMFNLARCWELGLGTLDEIEEDNPKAGIDLAVAVGLVKNDNGKEKKDQKRAFNLIVKSSEEGYFGAQSRLGWCYDNAYQVKKNEAEAVVWYRRSAEQGLAVSQCNLGVCYEYGRSMERNDWLAVKWYQEAAKQGLADAQCNLAWMYEHGRGVKKDDKTAAELYKYAASQGHARAIRNLGVCYEYGKGVAKDERRAVELFRMSAGKGFLDAYCNIGVCYEYGRGVPKDDTKAAESYQIAAANGLAVAQCNLALCYDEGTGVIKNAKVAAEWYRKSALAGHPRAQYQLAACYEIGKGVATDPKQAAEWYQKSAEQGRGDAMYCTGMCYQEGIGVKKDMEKAIYWLEKSAAEGWGAAMLELAFIYIDNPAKQEPYLIEAAKLHERQTAGAVTLIDDIQRNVEALAKMMPYYTQLWRIHLANKGKVGAEPIRAVLNRIAEMIDLRQKRQPIPVSESKVSMEVDELSTDGLSTTTAITTSSSSASLTASMKTAEWTPTYANPIGVQSLEELEIESVDMGDMTPIDALCSVLERKFPRFRLRIAGQWAQRTPTLPTRIFESLLRHNSLMALQLPHAPLTPSATQALCRWLESDKKRERASSLATLDLTGCLRDENSVEAVCKALVGHNWLQSLSLAQSVLKPLNATEALASLIATNKPLRMLSIRECELSENGQQILAKALAANASMEPIPHFPEPGLHGLVIADCKIGYEGQMAIATALSASKWLRELNIQRNAFDAYPLEKLLEINSLTLLHADMARLASKNFIELMSNHKILADFEMSNECVCFAECQCASSVELILSRNRSLRNLRIRAWSANPYFVGNLHTVLQTNRSLNNLALHANFDLMDEQSQQRHAAWAPVRALLARNTELDARTVANWVRIAVTVAFMRSNRLNYIEESILPLLPTISRFHGAINTRLASIDKLINTKWFKSLMPDNLQDLPLPRGRSGEVDPLRHLYQDIEQPGLASRNDDSTTTRSKSMTEADIGGAATPVAPVSVPNNNSSDEVMPAPFLPYSAAKAQADNSSSAAGLVNLGNFADVPMGFGVNLGGGNGFVDVPIDQPAAAIEDAAAPAPADAAAAALIGIATTIPSGATAAPAGGAAAAPAAAAAAVPPHRSRKRKGPSA